MSTPSYFSIKSKLSGLVLDIPSAPGEKAVVMYSANGGSNQQWTINEQGVIQSKLNSLALQGQNLWEKVVANPATGTPAQQWVITPQGQILNKKNFLALEIIGQSKATFAPVVLAQIKDNDLSQQWELVPVEENAPPTPIPPIAPPTSPSTPQLPVPTISWEALVNLIKSSLPQFSNLVSQATSNNLALSGTNLTSTVNGKASSVNLSAIFPKIAAGRTEPGATSWKGDGNIGVDVYIDTSALGFTKVPVYLTSLGGDGYQWGVTGASSIYEATAKGFKVCLRWDKGFVSEGDANIPTVITVAVANKYKWHINWIAFELP